MKKCDAGLRVHSSKVVATRMLSTVSDPIPLVGGVPSESDCRKAKVEMARKLFGGLAMSVAVILGLASDAGLIGESGLGVYCASKGGIVNLTRALALELAPDIRVNCVCPGYVDTDMVRRGVIEASDNPGATERAIAASAPMNRLASAAEIATAILYLASPDARFMTGSALQIDGGTTAGHPRQP